ncbi:MAG: M20/M25/M40 family metallo-hydrolase, partial [Propionibacteriales bacterium]|nr:M20/M25/M40 family metallo-hydrolase [Propionibacteriales bacterium]
DSEMGPHLVFEVPGRGSDARPVLLVGHHATVHPVGSLAEMPWRVDDGVAYGPGCYDMKSGLVVAAEAVRRLQQSGVAHPPVIMVVVADEEVGSPTSRELINELAGQVQAALGFESPHPKGELKRGRHGSTRVRISVTGKAAHAALDPESGVAATDELVDQLARLRPIVDREGVLCNVGSLTAPGKTNVVNDHAEAELGLRFAEARVESEVLDQLTSLLPINPRAEVRVEVLSRRPAWTPAADDTLLAAARAVAAELGQDFDAFPAAGAADTNAVGRLGVPTLDGLGPWGAGAHARHEQFDISALSPRIALVQGILAALA